MAQPILEISTDASPDNLAVIRHALDGLGESLAWDLESLADLKLAVNEVCTNVIMHAYEGAEGLMEISVSNGDRWRVTVRDFGKGIGPRSDSPGLGVGLPLVATLADSLKLVGTPGVSSEVTMTFSI